MSENNLQEQVTQLRERVAKHEAHSEHFITETKLRSIISEEMGKALKTFGHGVANQMDVRVVRHEKERHTYDDAPVRSRSIETRWLILGGVGLLVIGALMGRLVFLLLGAVFPELLAAFAGF